MILVISLWYGTSFIKADHNNSSRTPNDADSCYKYMYSSSHPTLTPGIFTLYCPHAVCYGFEVMRSHESPRRPFEIFLTHFEQPPTTIIYDNATPVRPQPPPNPLPEHKLFYWSLSLAWSRWRVFSWQIFQYRYVINQLPSKQTS
jgi:hypothetical protein